MREQQHVAGTGTNPGDHPVGARANRIHRLTAWTAVLKQTPAWSLDEDVRGAAALIFAVIPLHEVRVDLER